MHPVAVHWAKKSNCSAKEGYSASFRLSAYNDSCTALTHNWESLLLNTYKQHIAHFMMWEQKKNIELCCGWSKNTLAYVEIISQLLLHDKGSLQCAKSPITYGFKVFVFLLAKRSHNNPNLGLAKIWHQILRPLSGQFIWTRKKDPGDLIQLGKTVPQTARHQSPWFPKEGMKENTGIPHRCFNTYGQLMTRQKCQVKFLVGDWQKGVIN